MTGKIMLIRKDYSVLVVIVLSRFQGALISVRAMTGKVIPIREDCSIIVLRSIKVSRYLYRDANQFCESLIGLSKGPRDSEFSCREILSSPSHTPLFWSMCCQTLFLLRQDLALQFWLSFGLPSSEPECSSCWDFVSVQGLYWLTLLSFYAHFGLVLLWSNLLYCWPQRWWNLSAWSRLHCQMFVPQKHLLVPEQAHYSQSQALSLNASKHHFGSIKHVSARQLMCQSYLTRIQQKKVQGRKLSALRVVRSCPACRDDCEKSDIWNIWHGLQWHDYACLSSALSRAWTVGMPHCCTHLSAPFGTTMRI